MSDAKHCDCKWFGPTLEACERHEGTDISAQLVRRLVRGDSMSDAKHCPACIGSVARETLEALYRPGRIVVRCPGVEACGHVCDQHQHVPSGGCVGCFEEDAVWDDVLASVQQAWEKPQDYDQSPCELIRRLIDERDALRARVSALVALADRLAGDAHWSREHEGTLVACGWGWCVAVRDVIEGKEPSDAQQV